MIPRIDDRRPQRADRRTGGPGATLNAGPPVCYASAMSSRELVLILDFGAQYTQLIARRVREQRVYCEIHPCTLPLDQLRAMSPRAIILSGGPARVYAEDAPTPAGRVLQLR